MMMGAIGVHFFVYRMVLRRSAPVFGGRFPVLSRTEIDARLLGGAALFGIGWGLGGFCPGPAVVAAATLRPPVLIFVAAMLGGMALHDLFAAMIAAPPSKAAALEGTLLPDQ